MASFKWSAVNHVRCPERIQKTVFLLLLIQQRTRFVHKDMLLNHVLPECMGIISVPLLYCSNFLSNETRIQENGKSLFQNELERLIGPVHSLSFHDRYDYDFALVEFHTYADALYALYYEQQYGYVFCRYDLESLY